MSTPPPFEPVMPPPAVPPPSYSAPPANLPNHLVWNIVATVLATCFCCPIGLIGIVGIVYASQVNSKLAAGDIEGARQASNSAKTWAIVSSVLAVLGLLISAGMIMSMGGIEGYMQWLQSLQGMAG